jgi:FkbM family methyltransferase
MSSLAVLQPYVRSASLNRWPVVYKKVVSPSRYDLMFRLRRPHERDFLALSHLDREIKSAVDIGANIGQSILSIKTVAPQAAISAFEPHPRLSPRLRKVAARFVDVQVHSVALGASESMLELVTPVYNGAVLTTLAACDVPSARTWFDDGHLRGFSEDKLSFEREKVRVTTLDSFEIDPDFIKIDVQGSELAVILGSLRTIERTHPILLIESSDANDEIADVLLPYGYRAVEFDGVDFVAPAGRLNVFFLPSDVQKK